MDKIIGYKCNCIYGDVGGNAKRHDRSDENQGKAHCTNSTFVFCQHSSQPLKKQKSYFLPSHGASDKIWAFTNGDR